jgi:hypothetical protein
MNCFFVQLKIDKVFEIQNSDSRRLFQKLLSSSLQSIISWITGKFFCYINEFTMKESKCTNSKAYHDQNRVTE